MNQGADRPAPAGCYLPTRRHGSMLYISSVDSAGPGFALPVGTVGREFSAKEARGHAARCADNIISIIRSELGSLDAVDRIIQIRGLIRSTTEFAGHPKVIDGCSERLIELLGERGRHARTVQGVASLPGGTSVEIEAIIAVKPGFGRDHDGSP